MRIEAPRPDLGVSPWIIAILAPILIIIDNISQIFVYFFEFAAAALAIGLLAGLIDNRRQRKLRRTHA